MKPTFLHHIQQTGKDHSHIPVMLKYSRFDRENFDNPDEFEKDVVGLDQALVDILWLSWIKNTKGDLLLVNYKRKHNAWRINISARLDYDSKDLYL